MRIPTILAELRKFKLRKVTTMSTNVRIPQITSIDTAIRLYYERIELTNKDIADLFGKHFSSTVVRLKAKAREKMAENNIQSWNIQCVNTAAAYEAWGLSIDDLEYRRAKLQQLN